MTAPATLLMLPGTLCDARVFAPMLRAAGPLPLPVANGAMGLADSAANLAARLLESHRGPLLPVGFSLGAIVALEMAVRAPERIAGLALLAANARAVPPADWPARRDVAVLDPVHLVGDVLWHRSVATARLRDQTLKDTICAMARDAAPGTLARQVEVAITRSDKRAALPGLAMPALVIAGGQDQIAPPALATEMADALPRARLHLVPDAGHFVPLEAPESCGLALARWLADRFNPSISDISAGGIVS